MTHTALIVLLWWSPLLAYTSTTTIPATTLPLACRERLCADGSFPRVIVEGPCHWDEHKKGRVKCAVRPRADCHPAYYVYYRPESTIRIVCPEDRP
jgi:hypothetical protein